MAARITRTLCGLNCFVNLGKRLNRQLEIRQPIIWVLTSPPSTLGTIDYNMVLFESEHNSTFRRQMGELAENISDQEDCYPFFLLHSTTTWGQSITPLQSRSPSETQFCINRTNTDSVMLYHCLACRNLESNVLLKSGFHSWPVQENSDELLPSSWDSMKNMNGDVHFSVKINSVQFWRTYSIAVSKWRTEVVELKG